MAVDEALLISGGPPTLRLYAWSPPGLSIGYFQGVASFLDIPGEHVLVRRPTGGGAIYHDHEVTFALTLDTSLLPESIGESYRLIHVAVASALRQVGVDVRQQGDLPVTEDTSDSPWCFASPQPLDLVDNERRKILGSAQRRIRRPRSRTLNHGSLVLSRPGVTPFCAAVADQVSPEDVLPELEDYLGLEVAAMLALHPESGTTTDEELALAVELVGRKYGEPSFTNLR